MTSTADLPDASTVLVVGAAGAVVAEHLARLEVPHQLLIGDEMAEETARLAGEASLVLAALSPDNHRLLPLLQESGTPLWVDLADWDGASSELHDPFVAAATCLFLSDIDLDDALGTAERLLPGKELVVITHGKRGATAFFPDTEPFFVLPHDTGPAVSTDGARAAFCSGTAFGIARGWDWPRALRAGAVAAGGCVAVPMPVDTALTPEWLTSRL